MGNITERQSNLELLRILAAFMILTVHMDGASLGLPRPDTDWSAGEWWQTMFEAFAIIGVNLFVLISGYFGIRPTRGRIANYLIVCGFYSIGIFLLVSCLKPSTFTPDNAVDAVLFISRTDLWFVRDYFLLMLVCPLVNPGLETLNRRNLNLLMLALVAINCYFGWLWGGVVNPTGYNLMQMLFMYVTGAWLRRTPVSTTVCLVLYVVAEGAIVGSACVMAPLKAYAYNSPAVVLASISCFGIFRNLSFTSRVVNIAAAGTFAVYLVHKNPAVWGGALKPLVRSMSETHSGVVFFIICTAIAMLFFIIPVAIDLARVRLGIRYRSRNSINH